MLKPATVGSVSHATLRPEDLLSAFFHTLEGLVFVSGDYLSQNHAERDRFAGILGEAQDLFDESGEAIPEDKWEEAAEMINETLPDALQQFAPPYCYFGAHPGDGADFGFWPSLEAIDELPMVEDSDEAKALGEDCKAVNDHGNVTVYGADGSILLELV